MTTLQIFIELLKTLPKVSMVYILTTLFSLPFGILGALAYTRKNSFVRTILSLYTWIFRGSPLMLQLLMFYYGLPLIKFAGYSITLGPYQAGILTFIINYTAYFIEIIRGGIDSIDVGQHEAAKVLGYNYWQKMIYIILPQALRRVLPSLGNEAISLIKDTSLIYVLSITEIMKRTKELANTYYIISPYICSALIYLLLSFCVDKIFKIIESKNKIRL